MAGVRAWVRRELGEDPLWVPLPTNMDLGRAVPHIMRNDWDTFKGGELPRSEGCEWGILTGLLKDFDVELPFGATSSRRPVEEKDILIHKAWAYPRRLEGYALDPSENDAPGLEPSKQKEFVLGFSSDTRRKQCPEVVLLEDLLEAHDTGERVSSVLQDECWEPAQKLAIAIQGVMLTMRSHKSRFSRENESVPWERIPPHAFNNEYDELQWPDWQIDVQRESAVKGTWIIREVSKDILWGDTDDLARNLYTGLYLWVASLQFGLQLCSEAAIACGDRELWDNYGGLILLVASQQTTHDEQFCIRILGDDIERITQMASWMRASPNALRTFPAHSRKGESGDPENVDAIPALTFGLYYSAAFK